MMDEHVIIPRLSQAEQGRLIDKIPSSSNMLNIQDIHALKPLAHSDLLTWGEEGLG